MEKIIEFNKLQQFLSSLEKKSPLVLVGGVFDLIHLGHIRFLQQAKLHGTLLIALESDDNVKRRKGKNRPFHTQMERAEMLISIRSVDYVLLLPTITQDSGYAHLTEIISPAYVAVTEGDPHLPHKTQQAEKVDAKIIVIPKIPSPSTSQLAKLLELEN